MVSESFEEPTHTLSISRKRKTDRITFQLSKLDHLDTRILLILFMHRPDDSEDVIEDAIASLSREQKQLIDEEHAKLKEITLRMRSLLLTKLSESQFSAGHDPHEIRKLIEFLNQNGVKDVRGKPVIPSNRQRHLHSSARRAVMESSGRDIVKRAMEDVFERKFVPLMRPKAPQPIPEEDEQVIDTSPPRSFRRKSAPEPVVPVFRRSSRRSAPEAGPPVPTPRIRSGAVRPLPELRTDILSVEDVPIGTVLDRLEAAGYQLRKDELKWSLMRDGFLVSVQENPYVTKTPKDRSAARFFLRNYHLD